VDKIMQLEFTFMRERPWNGQYTFDDLVFENNFKPSIPDWLEDDPEWVQDIYLKQEKKVWRQICGQFGINNLFLDGMPKRV
jgi:hypothetical protein